MVGAGLWVVAVRSLSLLQVAVGGGEGAGGGEGEGVEGGVVAGGGAGAELTQQQQQLHHTNSDSGCLYYTFCQQCLPVALRLLLKSHGCEALCCGLTPFGTAMHIASAVLPSC